MKKTRKIFAVILALVMCFAMALPAMAATVSMKADSEYVKDHTFAVYQIFKGDLYDGKLSNIVYGQNYGTEDDKVPESELEGLKTTADATALAKKIMDEGKLVGGPIATLNAENSYTANDLVDGYYLIVDTTTLSGDDDANSAYIVKVAGENLDINPKADSPSMEKKVQEKNDSTGTLSGWQEGADYDIGDTVPFQLTATLPSDKEAFDAYETYEVVFHDKMSPGLTFNSESVVVTVGETTLTDGQYDVVTTGLDDECTFEVVLTDVKDLGAQEGDVITVDFSAILDDDAVIGGEGNPNEAQLEYSNNPNSNQKGMTPLEKVVVFTFETIVNKTDEEGNPLAGAQFTLYKWVEGSADDTAGDYDAPTGGVAGGYWKVVEVTDVRNQTTFDYKGLDSGFYKLVETETPEGYNSIDPMDFTISATYDTNSADPKLTDLTVTPNDIFTPEITTGTIEGDIVNKEGSLLPSTGGIGTTIFYVVGICLVVGAVVILVTRKRVGKNS